MEKTAESALYAVLSVSNFYFWSETDYFDIQSISKPLLHTWSLGVEEQFYLFWPLALVALLKMRSRAPLVIAMVVIGFGSLFLNPVFASGNIPSLANLVPQSAEWFKEGRANIFFLPIFRLFEFMIGASIVWLPSFRSSSSLVAEGLAGCGLAMIAAAVLIFSDQTVFPSFNALLPCIGAGLLIYVGPTRFVGQISSNRLAVAIGKISYSLYLIHWPLIVFYRNIVFRDINVIESIVIGITSVIISIIMYKFVEQPFRGSRNSPKILHDRAFITLAAGSAALVFSVSISAVVGNGWAWRIPAGREALTPTEARNLETEYCGGQEKSESLFTCVDDRHSDETIYVWGDSHSRHLISGLSEKFKNKNIKILYLSSCSPQIGLFGFSYDYEGRELLAKQCVDRNKKALSYFLGISKTTIIFHNYLRKGEGSDKKFINSTVALVDALTSKGHRVKIISDVIRPDEVLSDCYSVPMIFSDSWLQRRCVGDQAKAKMQEAENDKFGAQLPAGIFINMNDFFCGTGVCLAMKDGQPLFRDEHHLTLFGSEKFIEYAVQKGLRAD